MSIATEIQRIQTAKAGLKTSIEAKGVTVPSTTKIDGYPALVDQISSGGGTTVEENNVNFYDYDGELVYSYTKAEFLALTAMPPNPSHTGFTAQGWNWSLADAQDYVNNYDYLNIGQHYVTSDGKTRVYVHLDDPDYLFCQASWDQSVANGVSIDWGDGSESETVAGTGQKQLFHVYQNTGDYIVEYTVLNGTVRFGNGGDGWRIFGSAYCGGNTLAKFGHKIYKIELGTCAGFHSYCFKLFVGLKSLNIPSTAGTWDAPCDYIFDNCYMLKCVVIPNGVTYLGNSAFSLCYDMKAICIPNTVTQTRGSTFRNLHNIKMLTFPPNIIIRSTYGVSDNSSLEKLIMPNVKIYGTSGSLTFSNNYLVEALPMLTIYGESNITTIIGSTYAGCRSLKEFTVPSTVTTIGAYAFSNCLSLRKFVLEPITPPTLANTNAFTGIFNSCAMIVPYTYLSTYNTTTNWLSFKHRLVGYLATEPARVDYITTDGVAYINLLFPVSEIGKVQIEYRCQSTTTGGANGSIDGVFGADGKYAILGRNHQSNKFKVQWGGAELQLDINDGDWHTIEVDVLGKTAKIDNNSVSLSTAVIKSDVSYCTFRCYNSPAAQYKDISDRRSVKIWDVHGNLVRDMIPVKIDEAAYMYDRVDKLVFGNANSTGTLSYTDF